MECAVCSKVFELKNDQSLQPTLISSIVKGSNPDDCVICPLIVCSSNCDTL